MGESASLGLTGLLAHPRWRASVVVLAGSKLERPVDHVVAHSGVGTIPAVPANTLLALTSRPEPLDWRLDALLRRLADQAATALLLPMPMSLIQATVRLADRLGIVILGTADDVLALVVEARTLLAGPSVDAAALVCRVARAMGPQLLDPEMLVKRLHVLIDLPVAVLDGDGVRVAGDVEVTARPHPTCARQRLPVANGELLLAPAPDAAGRRAEYWIAARVSRNAAWRAPAVSDALDLAALSLQRWVFARRLVVERDARHRAALLGELLQLTTEPQVETRRRAADLGWRLDGWHIGVRIGVPPDVEVLGRTADVAAALRGEDLEAVVVEYGDGWSGWVTLDAEPTADQVRQLSQAIRHAHARLRQRIDAHVGVGRPEAGPPGIARTVAEADDAARLAVGRPETGRFLQVDSLGMAQLLLGWGRTETFIPAAHTMLTPLRNQPGDLIRTLGTYLDSESSLNETAAVLGVHRNTVASRVDRIKNLLGVDLQDRDERLALHLACRAVLMD
ncbi:PucR family transcriptional regulator [Streptomyces coffeae]|uniref:Helix-turn-helix domain-containing protein n=1 Tax=Streptomyces coffeae TaxID=621382 RepID=A0ABS1NN18_9ACTN|nr:PucR family transcriptional regulator [Streptomyces coffeae]MBL1101487.1 helix-turn-helix domain-containing protein [Streptomyces coffeae]